MTQWPQTRHRLRLIQLISPILVAIFSVVSVSADQRNLAESVDKANEFILKHNLVRLEPNCCDLPYDVDNDGAFNVADVVYLIRHVYFEGPRPPCPYAADIDGDCKIDVGDIVLLIRLMIPSSPVQYESECAPGDCEYTGYE